MIESLSLFDAAAAEEDALRGAERGAAKVAALEQYMTPRWAAELLVRRFFGDLNERDVVLDPSCGKGAWLEAIPGHVPAIGVEIDPELAAIARVRTGRRIFTGDFCTMPIDDEPTVILTNPPFSSALVKAFIARSRDLLPAGGRAGLLLPCHTLSFATSTLDLMRGFEVDVTLLPRDLYPRISTPLLFARLTKQSQTRLIGFALYPEAVALRTMALQYRRILEEGRRPLWREVLECALRSLGGEASLSAIYRVVEGFRPTSNPFWRDALRREAGQFLVRVRDGVYRLPEPALT